MSHKGVRSLSSQCSRRPPGPLTIVDPSADRAFSEEATRAGLKPEDPWVGAYAAYEWGRSRHLFDPDAAGVVDVREARVLELGCFVGATSVVLAALGARVVALDATTRFLPVARQNARRYGLEDRIELAYAADFSALPFEPASFDGVSCNSILEYLPEDRLEAVLTEIDRVLRPGGFVAVTGTGNWIWPKEPHTGRWLVHYLPSRLARQPPRAGEPGSAGAWRPRSLSPRRLRSAFAGYEDLILRDAGQGFARVKAKMGAGLLTRAGLLALGRLGRPLGLSAGMLLPSITLVLRKPGAAYSSTSTSTAAWTVNGLGLSA